MAQPARHGLRNAMSLLEETPMEEEGDGTDRVARVPRLGSLERREKPELAEEDLPTQPQVQSSWQGHTLLSTT